MGCAPAQPRAMSGTAEPPAADDTAPDAEDVRGKVCNDLMNTSVMAALVGGFALSNLQDDYDFDGGPSLNVYIYVANVFSVHLCTCSALTSAAIYRQVNNMDGKKVVDWSIRRRWAVCFPLLAFGVGTSCYILAVIFRSLRDLEGQTGASNMALVVGVMGAMVAISTFLALFCGLL
mmetsp:Transcript_67626/g.157001  ORF Transcript_67626/g.157001 Transcript_67626/m.157001 type:complete len:176 (-) Transcript_67626:71-598(-)